MSVLAVRTQRSPTLPPLALAPPGTSRPLSGVRSATSCARRTRTSAARAARARPGASLEESRREFLLGRSPAWIHAQGGEGSGQVNGQAKMMHTSQPGFDFMDRDEGSVRRRNITCSYILDDVPHLSEFLPHLKTYINPLNSNPAYAFVENSFVEKDDIVMQMALTKMHSGGALPCFRRSGPREQIYFNPVEVKAVIVTCGGLCPGLNTVIRELVWGLWFQYGVRHIYGIDGGYKGFYSRNWMELDPKKVNDIHKRGGTFLGTSRGGHDTVKIVNAIQDRGFNQVYIIGGDGTQRGAQKIYEECRRRGLAVSVAGIPKTIDNDIPIIDKSFGFDTAVEEAQRAICAAHVEAESTHQCVGIVKLMGRDCGQIAMHATLASRDVDCCLCPEAPFHLDGEGGLLKFIENRLLENDHCVIVCAEGAGQELIKAEMDKLPPEQRDASGNRALLDIGLWLSEHIKAHFGKLNQELQLKYIDPTYMIRAIPANASDNIYCTLLAHSAIHGAMAGFTGFVAGPVNGRHCYMPLHRITLNTNKVSLTDRMWARLLASTSQPTFLRFNSPEAKLAAAAAAPTENGPTAGVPGVPLAGGLANGFPLESREEGTKGAASEDKDRTPKSSLSSSDGSVARPVMPTKK